ncbi:hypothetical protein GALMADRAFT_146591 [Galerina marginata CBS 339.88]|uniref:Uncharacterized protein n=1 Tax=Galerina marginata (strain CBS 339.88) TaxID=685588 RepID=A0A067SB01_GALM3|nr:hypothetical protein GALMADRAFT_146591 [Galerina marginata CBS 339.88]
MKLIEFTALAICLFASQTIAGPAAEVDAPELIARQLKPISFNVSPKFAPCGSGTTISCSASSTVSCKGNFNPAQQSVVVTRAAPGCHISLYPDNDEVGGATTRVDAGVVGSCAFAPVTVTTVGATMVTSIGTWRSYGVFCN